MRRRILGLLAALIVSAALAGCGTNNFRDLEGVPSKNPDKVELFNNLDGHPNLALVCIHGVAFITTTRGGGDTGTGNGGDDAVNRVPELDRQCPGSVAK